MQVELVKKHEAKITIVCMALLALAAGYLLLTRPSHRIEGDFLEREDRQLVDEWLLSQLQVTIAEQRARACLALGRIADPATLSNLLAALNDHAASVRAAAAFAIGLMEDGEALAARGRRPRRQAADALLPLLNDDERAVVASAVEALGKLGFSDLSERLTETAAPHPITLTALVRLQAMQRVPWIAERLKSDDQDNRWAAALALNALHAPVDDGITRSFLNLTKDREALVRLEAVAGLGRATPSQETFEALVRMASDPDPKVRMAALESLGALRHAGTLEVLVESLRDRNENVIAASIRAIAKLGDHRAIKVLQPLRFRATVVSYQAEAALAALAGNDGEWLEPLWPLPPGYRTPTGVQAVAAALSLSRAPQSLDLLKAMWQDATPEIRVERPAILRALKERSAPNLGEYLTEASAASDANLQRAALEWIPNPDPKLCRQSFETAARQGATDLQLAALDAIARSEAARGEGAGDAKALLLSALDDPGRRVRIRAVKHLRQLFNEDHGEKIGPAKPRYERQDYQRIARTLGHRVQVETSAGAIEIALDYRNAALTAESFVEQVMNGTFEGRRVIEVAPARYLKIGAPPGDSPAEPEPTMRPEINRQPFLRGSLGLAATSPDSADNHFFIYLTPQPFADNRYTNFGRLVSGDDLLDAITVETRIINATVVE